MAGTVNGNLRTRRVPVDSLKPHPQNARRGDVALIRESLEAHGQYRAIVVRAKTGEVLAGNHTLAAARDLGWAKILVHEVDVDDDEARRIMLVDNRASDVGTYDDQALADLLSGLPDLIGTGFDQAALDTLLAGLKPEKAAPSDDAPPVPDDPVTKPGDLIVLGEHRLLCGDATVQEDVERLMGGELAACMWTDPPYGVDYVGKTAEALRIQNDTEAGIGDLLAGAFACATDAIVPGGSVYLAGPAGPLSRTFTDEFVNAGWQFRQTLIWVKDSLVLGRSDYHYRHEPILYGFTAGGDGRRGRGGDNWHGNNAQTTVFEVPRPKASREHPTMKPIDLVSPCLSNSARPEDIVLDPFGGSGTTLLAADHLGQRARLMELDPAYCDVIVDRWQTYTGETAQRP